MFHPSEIHWPQSAFLHLPRSAFPSELVHDFFERKQVIRKDQETQTLDQEDGSIKQKSHDARLRLESLHWTEWFVQKRQLPFYRALLHSYATCNKTHPILQQCYHAQPRSSAFNVTMANFAETFRTCSKLLARQRFSGQKQIFIPFFE